MSILNTEGLTYGTSAFFNVNSFAFLTEFKTVVAMVIQRLIMSAPAMRGKTVQLFSTVVCHLNSKPYRLNLKSNNDACQR